jgi:alkylhydroperoxidase family enzyme
MKDDPKYEDSLEQHMRLSDPRIVPLAEADLSDEQAEIIAPTLARGGTPATVIMTLMRHMPLFTNLNVLGRHIMSGSSLTPRQREILIMRVGWNTQCEYQWGQHVLMSESAGLDAADHERIKQGPEAGWDELESALLTAVDELVADTMISDATWSVLEKHLATEQLIDTIFTVGHYHMVAMALNSIGVQREAGIPGFAGKQGD